MRLSICGNDERSKSLKMLAEERGIVLTDISPDAVILPLPKSKLADLKRIYPNHQLMIAGKAEDALKEAAERNGWRLLDALEDEAFVRENAELTAEGAIYHAMKEKKKALCKGKSMVLGYGRIGRYLTKMLRGLGTEVTVCARSEKARKEAGESSVDIKEMERVIGEMDFIFNTIPCPVLMEKELKKMNKNALLMELASSPYGVDMEAAARLNVKVHLESGIPGRYCPMDAAEAFMKLIERSVSS